MDSLSGTGRGFVWMWRASSPEEQKSATPRELFFSFFWLFVGAQPFLQNFRPCPETLYGNSVRGKKAMYQGSIGEGSCGKKNVNGGEQPPPPSQWRRKRYTRFLAGSETA